MRGTVYSACVALMQKNHVGAPHAVLIRQPLHGYGIMLHCSVAHAVTLKR